MRTNIKKENTITLKRETRNTRTLRMKEHRVRKGKKKENILNHTSANCEVFLCDDVYDFIRALYFHTSTVGGSVVDWISTFEHE